MLRKMVSSRLFLLSFFDPPSVHQKALAKWRTPYYAWCSSGTSTQDVVDFDLQEESRNPDGGRAMGGRGPRAEIPVRLPVARVVPRMHETAAMGVKRAVGIHNDKISTGDNSMHLTSASAATTTPPPRDVPAGETGSAMPTTDPRFAQYKVIRRNGAVVGFEPAKITVAMTKAFLAVNGGQGAASARVRDEVSKLTEAVVTALMKRKPEGG